MHPNLTQYFDELRREFRAAREAKGWTRAELADRLEVHWVTISKIERGVIQMSSTWADRLSLALGTNVKIISGEPGDVQPQKQAPRMDEAREGVRDIALSRASDLREYIEEVIDLLHALDKIGDGIGGADGYSVSAVALAAKSVADNALDAVKAMERAQ